MLRGEAGNSEKWLRRVEILDADAKTLWNAWANAPSESKLDDAALYWVDGGDDE